MNNKVIKRYFYVGADYGMGPWGWEVKVHEDGTRSGANCADAYSTTLYGRELPNDFVSAINRWTEKFEKAEDVTDFNWNDFNKEGLSLAIQLKPLIEDLFDGVFYSYPTEDPAYSSIYKHISVQIK